MDKLENKRYFTYDYNNRYTGVPYYYHTGDLKDVFGLGSNLLTTTSWVAHKVSETDNLDKLALKYYNNPTYWWIIADFNRIKDPFVDLWKYYDILKIPQIASIEFGDDR